MENRVQASFVWQTTATLFAERGAPKTPRTAVNGQEGAPRLNEALIGLLGGLCRWMRNSFAPHPA